MTTFVTKKLANRPVQIVALMTSLLLLIGFIGSPANAKNNGQSRDENSAAAQANSQRAPILVAATRTAAAQATLGGNVFESLDPLKEKKSKVWGDVDSVTGDGSIFPSTPACGGSESTYDKPCALNMAGLQFMKFPDKGFGGVGDTYTMDKVNNSRPQFGFNVQYLGYSKTCDEPREIPASIDPLTGKVIPARTEIVQVDCSVGGKTVWVKPLNVVKKSTPGTISGLGGFTTASCNSTFTYDGVSGTIQNRPVTWDAVGPDGKPYSAPFVGYKVRWAAATSDGVNNLFDTYSCLPPAAAVNGEERCYTELNGTVKAYVPDRAIWNQFKAATYDNLPEYKGMTQNEILLQLKQKKILGDNTKLWPRPDEKTQSAQKLDQSGDNWLLTAVPQATRYTDKGKAKVGESGGGALTECRTEKSEGLKWNYPTTLGKNWGLGSYQTNLMAPYDIVHYIHFTHSDEFDQRTGDIIVQVDSNAGVADYTDPGSDIVQAWRSTLFLYCLPELTPDGTIMGGSTERLEYTGSYEWLPTKINPAELIYTMSDCAQMAYNKTGGEGYSWTCNDPGLLTYGTKEDPVPLPADARNIQSQADGVTRYAYYGEPNPGGRNGADVIRNINNRKMMYEATDNASPRLVGTTPYEDLSRQPFTFKPELGQWQSNWSADSRNLRTVFREASRTGKDFPIRPLYEFNAEFKMQTITVNSYNTRNGYQTSTSTTWMPSTPTCVGEWIAIDVLRVGSIPN